LTGLPEDGDRIQSPKRFYVLNKNRTMDYVQKHNNCVSVIVKLKRTAYSVWMKNVIGKGFCRKAKEKMG
jgi:hypothetical protein